jgi:hypothetical protein
MKLSLTFSPRLMLFESLVSTIFILFHNTHP